LFRRNHMHQVGRSLDSNVSSVKNNEKRNSSNPHNGKMYGKKLYIGAKPGKLEVETFWGYGRNVPRLAFLPGKRWRWRLFSPFVLVAGVVGSGFPTSAGAVTVAVVLRRVSHTPYGEARVLPF